MKILLIESLREYRKDHNLTYAELAKLLDTSSDVTWDLLNGRRQYIDLAVLQRAQNLLARG